MVVENGNPFVHLHASEIQACNLQSFVSDHHDWLKYCQKQHTQWVEPSKPVSQCWKYHNQDQFMWKWIMTHWQSRMVSYMQIVVHSCLLLATLKACLILDLNCRLPMVGYFTTMDVQLGMELMMDWGKNIWCDFLPQSSDIYDSNSCSWHQTPLSLGCWPQILDTLLLQQQEYIHVLSLCHLYPLPVTWRIQMRTFKRYLSHAILLTTLHLREMN
jgi:hypothetical protein